MLVCTGNTCRSPMAAVLLEDALIERGLAERWTVGSAGTSAGSGAPASQHAQLAVAELGLDLSQHRSRPVDQQLVASATLILTLTQRHADALLSRFPECRDRLRTLGSFISSPATDIRDPYGGSLEEYIACRDQIHSMIPAVVDYLEQL